MAHANLGALNAFQSASWLSLVTRPMSPESERTFNATFFGALAEHGVTKCKFVRLYLGYTPLQKSSSDLLPFLFSEPLEDRTISGVSVVLGADFVAQVYKVSVPLKVHRPFETW